MAIEITDANFKELVLNSDKPVMLRFLGRMVRSLPHGRPFCRRIIERIRW